MILLLLFQPLRIPHSLSSFRESVLNGYSASVKSKVGRVWWATVAICGHWSDCWYLVDSIVPGNIRIPSDAIQTDSWASFDIFTERYAVGTSARAGRRPNSSCVRLQTNDAKGVLLNRPFRCFQLNQIKLPEWIEASGRWRKRTCVWVNEWKGGRYLTLFLSPSTYTYAELYISWEGSFFLVHCDAVGHSFAFL